MAFLGSVHTFSHTSVHLLHHSVFNCLFILYPSVLLFCLSIWSTSNTANWYSKRVLLCDFSQESVGRPLFLMVSALNQQISKGPVDAVTEKALYTLNEDWLLWQAQGFNFSMLVCSFLIACYLCYISWFILDPSFLAQFAPTVVFWSPFIIANSCKCMTTVILNPVFCPCPMSSSLLSSYYQLVCRPSTA